VGYFEKYFEKNNAFSDHMIESEHLYDRIGKSWSISFLTSLYNSYKQPVVMFIQSYQSKFLGRIRHAISDKLNGVKPNFKN